MATAMDVFERMIHLSDNGDETTGEYDIPDNVEYKNRILSIINVIINEIYPYSDTCVSVAGKRSVLNPITSLNEEINLDNYCIEVLVYGVAARMFTDENGNISSFYEQEYERRLNDLKSGAGLATEATAIEDVYSGTYVDGDGNVQYMTGYYPYKEFGWWG